MLIRTITATDYIQVDQLIRKAFTQSHHGYGNEAELVHKIRMEKSYIPALEIVAVENNIIVGHGLLSEGKIVNTDKELTGLVLAPLSILPTHQKLGIGKRLMNELEKRGKKVNYPFISILGHPSYYSKFGYLPASKFNISAPFDVPDEAFMIKELTKDALKNVAGTIRYLDAFIE